eukprot:CAMPEP_0170742690 /NCGR_PEP_ID=MMETSP0437-20130122/6876_1 /TAXON_ID=0 /ORGANISM="Sexangularia sp." /LENGTH=790 /DNA_ID=CAMNT_0011081323 /DNA_START=1 /DNA_END=2374 /DNA_ORIENTATION=+
MSDSDAKALASTIISAFSTHADRRYSPSYLALLGALDGCSEPSTAMNPAALPVLACLSSASAYFDHENMDEFRTKIRRLSLSAILRLTYRTFPSPPGHSIVALLASTANLMHTTIIADPFGAIFELSSASCGQSASLGSLWTVPAVNDVQYSLQRLLKALQSLHATGGLGNDPAHLAAALLLSLSTCDSLTAVHRARRRAGQGQPGAPSSQPGGASSAGSGIGRGPAIPPPPGTYLVALARLGLGLTNTASDVEEAAHLSMIPPTVLATIVECTVAVGAVLGLLANLVRVRPTMAESVADLLINAMPHPSAGANVLVLRAVVCLVFSELCPRVREYMLLQVVRKVTHVDAMLGAAYRDAATLAAPRDDGELAVFDMDEDQDEVGGGGASGAAGAQAVTTLSSLLDRLLCATVAHLDVCYFSERVSAESRVSSFSSLLSVLAKTALRADRPVATHVLLFIASSSAPSLPGTMCAYFFSILEDETNGAITRATAASYLGSYVARAAFLPPSLVLEVLTRMAGLVLGDASTRQPLSADGKRHAVPLYVTAAALAYLMCFRLSVLVEVPLATLADFAAALMSPAQVPLRFVPRFVLVELINVLRVLSLRRPDAADLCDRLATACNNVLAIRRTAPLPPHLALDDVVLAVVEWFPFDPLPIPMLAYFAETADLFNQYESAEIAEAGGVSPGRPDFQALGVPATGLLDSDSEDDSSLADSDDSFASSLSSSRSSFSTRGRSFEVSSSSPLVASQLMGTSSTDETTKGVNVPRESFDGVELAVVQVVGFGVNQTKSE